MIKISEFKAKLSQLVRPNRFLVTLSPPAIFEHGQDLELLTFLTQGAKIPEKNIGEIEIKYHGMSLKLPGDQTHEDLTLTFYNHYGWEARDMFEDWIEVLQTTGNNNERTDAINAIDDSSIMIQQIGDVEEDILAEYTFYNVFPKSVSEIELSMDNYDSVETFTVSFAYSHWIQTT